MTASQGQLIFFYEEPDSKYFWPWGPCGCSNSSLGRSGQQYNKVGLDLACRFL